MKKTILLFAENLDSNATLVRKVLTARKHEVLWVNTFEKAVDMISVYPPDLIVIDTVIPYIDGKSPVGFFRNIPRLNNVPIIGMITSTEEITGIPEKEGGCDRYVQKPVDIQHLTDAISHFLKKT